MHVIPEVHVFGVELDLRLNEFTPREAFPRVGDEVRRCFDQGEFAVRVIPSFYLPDLAYRIFQEESGGVFQAGVVPREEVMPGEIIQFKGQGVQDDGLAFVRSDREG